MPVSPLLTFNASPFLGAIKKTEPLPTDADALVCALVTKQYNGCAMPVFRPPSEGGRRIVTTRKVQLGEIVGRSKNQMTIGAPANPAQEAIWEKVCSIIGTDYDHEIVWAALNSLLEDELPNGKFPLKSITKDLQQLICLHFFPEITPPTPSIVKLQTELGLRCTPEKLEKVVGVWNCNSLDHTYQENTSILSLGFALMNHACWPTVSWEVQNDEVVLRATVDLEVGAELSVSYVDDCEMHKPTKLRQDHMVSTGKGFVCGCPRCSGPELCRHVVCPVSGCPGVISLGSAKLDSVASCGKCGRTLSAAELTQYADKEDRLEEMMKEFMGEDECDSSGESDIEEEIEAPEAKFNDFEQITPERLDDIREIASSGKWLAPTGHWLAHRAYGLLKDVAWDQEACPSTTLECLDQRGAFVRQAYPTVAPNPPPIIEHGLELLEAAELLLKADGWPSEYTQEKRRVDAAKRLQESIAVLEPMRGSTSKHVRKARKYLATLNGDAGAAKRGQKRGRD